jgi:hypothetical protein
MVATYSESSSASAANASIRQSAHCQAVDTAMGLWPVHSCRMTSTWLCDWPDHDWQIWDYSVSHRQLHLRGIPMEDPSGECVELLFKPVHRLATSTMSWSCLRLALRRISSEGVGVFFLVSTRPGGRHVGHRVVRAGSLHQAAAGLHYWDSVLDHEPPLEWRTLWRAES